MNTVLKELKKALENVSDTYEDFVRGIPLAVDYDEENQRKILDFIKNNEQVTTSEVIDYVDKLRGLI